MPAHATQKDKERWWALHTSNPPTSLRAIASRCGFSYQIVARYILERRCIEAIPPPKVKVGQ